ncbi:MAG: endolytic transglycosylase MltG, partial [Paramuribaculum sp.]|nr:endolytic transglycosylase MltG [Paramuribaculum sp.]
MASNTPEIKKDSRTARSASRAANRPKQTTRQSKRRSKKKPLGKGVAWTIGITLTLVGLCGAALLIGIIGYHGPDKWVKIPSASTSGEVHQSLRDSLGTAEGNRVYLLWKVMGSDAATASGAYLIPHGQSAFTTARKLRNGAQTPVKVTLRGLRLMQPMAERLTAPLECSSADFLAACATILPAEGFTPEEFPAAFIPDTYEMYWNSSPSKVVRRLLTYRDRFWNEERRDKASALGLSPVQVATTLTLVGLCGAALL